MAVDPVEDSSRAGDKKAIEALRELADNVGARWHELQADDPAAAIIEDDKKRRGVDLGNVIAADDLFFGAHGKRRRLGSG